MYPIKIITLILIYICYNFIRVSHSQKSSPLPKSFLPHPSFPIFFPFTKPLFPSTFSVSVTRTQNNPVLVPQGSNGTAGGRQGQQGQQGAAGAAATLENVTAREIPRSAITLLQQIGEGQFGEVSLAVCRGSSGFG